MSLLKVGDGKSKLEIDVCGRCLSVWCDKGEYEMLAPPPTTKPGERTMRELLKQTSPEARERYADVLVESLPEEASLDDFDIGAQEGHILQSFIEGLGGTSPHAGAFNIDADEVGVWIKLGQFDGVFTFATTQFEYDGVLIVEVLFMPMSLHLNGNMFHYRIGVLEHVLVGCHIGKFSKFTFAHVLFVNVFRRFSVFVRTSCAVE